MKMRTHARKFEQTAERGALTRGSLGMVVTGPVTEERL
jgi:hypothetical protein